MTEIQVNLREFAPDDRIDAWRSALYDGLHVDCRIEPLRSPKAFDASLQQLECGHARLVALQGEGFLSARAGLARKGWVSMLFQIDGHARVSTGRDTLHLHRGQACIVPPEGPVAVDRLTPFRQIFMSVEHDRMDQLLPTWREQMGRNLSDSRAPQFQAVTDLLEYLLKNHAVLHPAEREQLSEMAARLIGGATEQRPARDPRPSALQKRRVEDYIDTNLRNGALSVASIALALRVSPRYLHKLFADTEGGLMHRVWQRRLEACRRELMQHRHATVGEVAYAWGFNSLPHFSRAFRARYGHSPREC